MPIYEYRCDACGHCFEILILSKEHEAVNCPECGQTEISKLMSCINAFDGAKSGFCTSGSSSGGFS